MPDSNPIRMGLIGAGIFARDAHLPALQELGAEIYKITAICSRTKESATRLAKEIPYPVEITTDIATLLARDDVDAVNIMLPIDLMPSVVQMALDSGKHVISEKPVAPDVKTGKELLSNYKADCVWMVAENFRYQETFIRAAELIKNGEIGKPLLANWTTHIPFTADNKYYHTDWRRDGSFPGGIFLDGGVHSIAVLRLLFGEITKVNAFATYDRSDLPGINTISSNLEFDSGLIANYSVTFSAAKYWSSPLTVCGEDGLLEVDFDKIAIIKNDESHTISFNDINNVRAELSAFAASINDGSHHLNSPEQALQDVAIIEALLQATKIGQSVIPERIV
jgi:predicted dehydrogenase